MLNISGYMGAYDEEIIDEKHRLLASCCGHYKLAEDEQYSTWRAFGRNDFQLLYVAGGSAEFSFNAQKVTVEAEAVVLLYPGEQQKYAYLKGSCADVYWVHFSGTEVEAILKRHHLYPERIFSVTAGKECIYLFDRMIREFQLKRPDFDILTTLYLETLLLLFSRTVNQRQNGAVQNAVVEQAVLYFHNEYQKPIEIQAYAKSCGISCCWFIRTFKRHTGMTPIQYLTAIRINKALELLNSGALNIRETALFVGYENPLYFSRVFKKVVGMAPRDYLQKEYFGENVNTTLPASISKTPPPQK